MRFNPNFIIGARTGPYDKQDTRLAATELSEAEDISTKKVRSMVDHRTNF